MSWKNPPASVILIPVNSRSHDKGKPPETEGRKVPGLNRQTAELPNVNGTRCCVSHPSMAEGVPLRPRSYKGPPIAHSRCRRHCRSADPRRAVVCRVQSVRLDSALEHRGSDFDPAKRRRDHGVESGLVRMERRLLDRETVER